MSDEPKTSPLGGAPSPGWRILVVDDEATVRTLAQACIRHGLGREHQTLQAANGEDAIAVAERDHPDLILLDIMMPHMDGFEVCRRLKAAPTTKDIPIVFLTALGAEKDISRGLELGGDGYIVKPFNAVTLAAQITELLGPTSEHTD